MAGKRRAAARADARRTSSTRPRGQATASSPALGSAESATGATLTGRMLDLQHQAGNRAVASLVVQRSGIDEAARTIARAGSSTAAVLSTVAPLLASDWEQALAAGLLRAGLSDRNDITNIIFWLHHPDRIGTKIQKGEADLAAEWLAIRRTAVDPAIANTREPSRGGSGAQPQPSAGSSTPAMDDEERARLIEAAKSQGSGGTAELRAQMESALPAGTSLDDWFAGHVPDATFLGLRIRASGGSVGGVHREFLTQLQKAEQALRDKFPGQDDKAIRSQVGLRQLSGLRPPKPATGGSLPSMHCFGMAVDINAATNPFVGHKKVSKGIKDPATRARFAANRSPRVIERAMLLLHGERFNVESPLGAKSAGQAWDLHARASQALAAYLRLAEADDTQLAAAVERARAAGDANDLVWWRKRIADDKAYLEHWDFHRHPSPEKSGYLDLGKALVVALIDDGQLSWGGRYRGAKDMMHFDYRRGSIQRRKG